MENPTVKEETVKYKITTSPNRNTQQKIQNSGASSLTLKNPPNFYPKTAKNYNSTATYHNDKTKKKKVKHQHSNSNSNLTNIIKKLITKNFVKKEQYTHTHIYIHIYTLKSSANRNQHTHIQSTKKKKGLIRKRNPN